MLPDQVNRITGTALPAVRGVLRALPQASDGVDCVSVARPRTPSFSARAWEGIELKARVLCGDILLFLIAIAGLTLVFMALQGLSVLGYPPERIEILETLHYWAYVVILASFVLDLLVKIFLAMLRGE